MSRRNLIILIVVAIIIVLLIVFGIQFKGKKELSSDVFHAENPDALPSVEGGTREIIQKEIATPELGATDVPENVAMPTNVTGLSGAGGESSLRDFEIKAENGKFSPNTIVVNNGDIITLHLTAVDADYNIFFPDFGSYLAAKKGETKKTQFQTAPFGQYQFLCKDCNNDAKGTLIVNEK